MNRNFFEGMNDVILFFSYGLNDFFFTNFHHFQFSLYSFIKAPISNDKIFFYCLAATNTF